MYNYISCIHLKIVLVISIYETMTTENGRLGVELVWRWNTFMLNFLHCLIVWKDYQQTLC